MIVTNLYVLNAKRPIVDDRPMRQVVTLVTNNISLIKSVTVNFRRRATNT